MTKILGLIPAHPKCDPARLKVPTDPRLDIFGVLHLPANPGHFGAWPRVHPTWGPHNGGTYAQADFRKHVEALIQDVPKRIPAGFAGLICLDLEHIDRSNAEAAALWTRVATDLIRQHAPSARIGMYNPADPMRGSKASDVAFVSYYATKPIQQEWGQFGQKTAAYPWASQIVPVLWGQYHDSLSPAGLKLTPLHTRTAIAAAVAAMQAGPEIAVWCPCTDANDSAISSWFLRLLLKLLDDPAPLTTNAVKLEQMAISALL